LNPTTTFHARLSAALSQEPAIISRARPRMLKIGLSGLAAACVVVSAIWLVRPAWIGGDEGVTVLAEAGTAPTVASGRLSEYLDAHWQIAGSGVVRYVSFDVGAQR